MKKKTTKQPQHIHRYAYTRLRLIISELQRGNYPNKARLAELIGRTPRTVHRDLAALRDDYNAPIAFNREQNGFYLTDPKWQLPELRLTEGELISFFVAERVLRRLSDTAEVQLARSALAKLAAHLPEEVVVDVEALEAAIDFAPDPALGASPVFLRQLAAAASKRQTLRIHYFSQNSNKHTERDVNVLLLHNSLGEWYAVCEDLSDGKKIKDFHAGRISKLAQTHRTFQPPEDWDAQEYLKRGFGMFRGGKDVTVEIEFDAHQARYARERKFHTTQNNKELPAGRLRVTFETSEAALGQVARWLMQYGSHAEA
ncbi:MAG: WYL domain-containing protein, partial [Acidobacteria bacterium]|nr:WYL domain-containing protein [Acidobacteriota bacterium]